MLAAFALGVSFSWAQAPATPLAPRVLPLLELRDAAQGSDLAKMRELAFSDLPSNASLSTIDLYSGAQMGAAMALNELGQLEKILRRWIAANPSNLDPKFILLTTLSLGVGTQLEEAFALGQELINAAGFPSSRVNSRSAVAELHVRTGEFAKAEQVLEDARRIVESDLQRWGTAGVRAYWNPYTQYTHHTAWCRLQVARNRLDDAERHCRQALAAMTQAFRWRTMMPALFQVNAATRMSDAWLTIAEVQLARNALFDAEGSVQQALALARENRAAPYLSFQASDVLWRIRMAQNDFSALRQMVAEIRRTAQSAGVSQASLGFVTFRRNYQTGLVLSGQWREAAEHFDEADRAIASADPVLKRAALHIVPRALAWHQTGRAAQALPLVDEEWRRARVDLGERHARTALLLGLRGMLRAALPGTADADGGAALQDLAAAVSLMTDPATPAVESLEYAESALARRMVFQAYLSRIGEQPAPALAQQAFRVADLLRASSVQQALNEAAARGAASTAGLGDLVRRDQDASHELQALYDFIARQNGEVAAARLDAVVAQMKQRIAELERDRAGLRAEIARQFPQYDRLVRPVPPGLSDVQGQLAPGEVFVSLLPTDEHVHVWAVSASGQSYHRAVLPRQVLERQVAALRDTLDVAGLGARMPRFDATAAHALHQQLLAPLAPLLRDARHLIVAPSGALAQLPFGVLLARPWTDGPAASAAWLIKDHAISHVASASAWIALKQLGRQAPADQALMAWADPLFDRAAAAPPQRQATRSLQLLRATAASGATAQPAAATAAPASQPPRAGLDYARIPALPETRDEVEAIARSLRADPKADVLQAAQATRESVLAASKAGLLARKRVLVFATHGLIPGDLPNLTQPALAMAATGREAQEPHAPLLTLEDVLTLKLNADWVVLSACNTASADGRGGEALSGLARGFFYAGGRSLLVTHWSVESESAARLTTYTFAHQAGNPGATRAESLRQAMLRVMGEPAWAHPAYWAPYALVGEGGR